MNQKDSDSIASTIVPYCYLCESIGETLYSNLRDRMFGGSDLWNLKACPKLDCGLIWLYPMPTREDIWKAYKDDYYTHKVNNENNLEKTSFIKRVYDYVKAGYLARQFGYPTTNSSWQKLIGSLVFLHPIRRAFIDCGVLRLNSQPGGRLLEVGCASGGLLEYLQSLGWQTEGVEIDPVAVEQARLKKLQVRLGQLEDQGYPHNHFDVIVMSHVIEHIHDPLELLRECRRILKPNGRLVIITPNLESWGHQIFKSAWLALDPPRHLYLFTKQSLQALTIKADFKIRALKTEATGARWIYLASRAISSTGKITSNLPFPKHVRLQATIFLWLEWALLKWKPSLGENVILIGEK